MISTHVKIKTNYWVHLRWALGLFFVIGLLFPCLTAKPADAKKRSLKISKTNIPAKNKKLTAIVIDAQTGLVLYENNAYSRRCPASMTKMMTLYLVFQELRRKKLHFETQLKISRHAANQKPTKLGLQAGTTISVRDALLGSVTKSANDAASVLAEAISGTEEKFVKLMNRTSRKLGLKDTVFVNASGWPDDARGVLDPRLTSTAHDMAKLAQILIKEFPEYYKFFAIQRFTYRGKTYKNTNSLLGKVEGLDGLKTGFWRGGGSQGFNLASSAKRGKTRIIAVIMGARTPQERNNKMTTLLEKGFILAQSHSPKNSQKQSPARKKNAILDLESLQEILQENHPEEDLNSPISNNSSSPEFDQELANILAQEKKTVSDLQDNLSVPPLPLPPSKPVTISKKSKKTKPPFGHTKDLPPITKDVPPIISTEPQKKWAVQVGTFTSNKIAKSEGQKLSQAFPNFFKGKLAKVYPPKKDGKKQFPVRFIGLSKHQATQACQTLVSQKKPCLVIAPKS